MIFVQIAAYRDPELLPTIINCIAKAKYKNDLVFGVCWQKHPTDNCLDHLMQLKNFRVDVVPWEKSCGLGWARARIQGLYNGEAYTLQLDSHHRFVDQWDERLIEAMELTGSPKPIITSYAALYDPKTNQKSTFDPYKMVAERFTESGTILFRPHVIPDWQELTRPVPARFVSGHFFFTLGSHCLDYTYDPQIYFAGDEISLRIRSFTHGYDLFHPHRVFVWHEYTREGRIKHWDDHTTENKDKVTAAWHERDLVSKRRLRKLLREEYNEEDITGYDLGNARSHGEYEIYAGIDFSRRRLQLEAIRGIDPPCTFVNSEQWEHGFATDYCLTLQWEIDDIETCDDINFIYFGVEDESGNVLYRYDAPPESAEARLLVSVREVHFRAGAVPTRLIVWPVSHSLGWLRKVCYRI